MSAWARSERWNACLRGSRRHCLLQTLRPTLRDDMFERPILFDRVRDALSCATAAFADLSRSINVRFRATPQR